MEDKKYSIGSDVETAWDVLIATLDGAGIVVGNTIDDALFNGCSLISAAIVKNQAQALATWTHGQVLERFRKLNKKAELYHFQVHQDDEDYLLEQFDCLVNFYKEAEKGLGAISYVA